MGIPSEAVAMERPRDTYHTRIQRFGPASNGNFTHYLVNIAAVLEREDTDTGKTPKSINLSRLQDDVRGSAVI